MTDIGAVDDLLSELKDMLAADGYGLRVRPSAGGLHIDVVATPEACADCLVPQEVFVQIIRDTLPSDVGPISVTYP